jgi:hypothetical protein
MVGPQHHVGPSRAPVAESTAAILVAVADKEAVLAAGAATSIAASISSVST